MDKGGGRPIGFKGVLKTIGPQLVPYVLNRVKGKGSGGRERGRIGPNGHTEGRICSCQTFVRRGVKEKGGNPLLVIDADVADTRED